MLSPGIVLKKTPRHLKHIQETCERASKRKFLARFFLSKKDAGDLQGIQRMIEFNIKVFNVRTNNFRRSQLVAGLKYF